MQGTETKRLAVLLLFLIAAIARGQHQDLFVGHSPPHPIVDPAPGNPCPTLSPRKLFLADNAAVGGAIPPNGGLPADMGQPIELSRVSVTAPLGRPEFGGFVWAANQPGFNFIDPANLCHGMSTAAAGGSFVVRLERWFFPDGVNFALADAFGVPVLRENGNTWTFGNSSDGGHVHPFFLAYRPGSYVAEFRLTSDRFPASDRFSLSYSTGRVCGFPKPLDISSLFNADVVDSDGADVPVSFDGAGRFWLLNGHYGTDRGLPRDGMLEAFQLGGPDGIDLLGANPNCLLDDGTRTTESDLDLAVGGQNGRFLSMELLIAAAGATSAYTSGDRLVVTLSYDSGNDQVVNVRQAVSSPLFLPIRDWRNTASPVPLLSVGRTGTRDGGGFVRSTGSGTDAGINPPDAFYFSRVPFPLDPTRELRRIRFGDYSGRGRLGVFAVTVIAQERCRDMDADEDGDVDGVDYADFWSCFEGPDVAYTDPDCAVFDTDRSDTVDLRDAAELQRRFTGRR